MHYGPADTLNLALAFVQNIPYGLDLNTTGYLEYARYPVETLVDRVGDCDCKSVLFLGLVQTAGLGYDGVLLEFIGNPGHMAVGVAGNFQGRGFSYQGHTYFYCETTAIGYTVGVIPPEVSAEWQAATIIPA